MYPYLLPKIFGYNVPMYDIMIMLGIFAMLTYVANRFEKNDGLTRKQTNIILIYIVISLGASLLSAYVVDGVFHTIGNYGDLHDLGYSFIEIIKESFGSITFIGGLVGGVATFVLLYKYRYKEDNKDIKKVLNTLITGIVLAHAFGRIGCFTAGCCYGIPTDSIFGVVFPYGHSGQIPVFPTQIYESIFLFILFFLLNNIKSFKNIEFEIYLIGYGGFRFLNEFLRGDDRGSVFGVIRTQYTVYPSPSQLLSFIMLIVGIYLLRKNKKKAIKE